MNPCTSYLSVGWSVGQLVGWSVVMELELLSPIRTLVQSGIHSAVSLFVYKLYKIVHLSSNLVFRTLHIIL